MLSKTLRGLFALSLVVLSQQVWAQSAQPQTNQPAHTVSKAQSGKVAVPKEAVAQQPVVAGQKTAVKKAEQSKLIDRLPADMQNKVKRDQARRKEN